VSIVHTESDATYTLPPAETRATRLGSFPPSLGLF